MNVLIVGVNGFIGRAIASDATAQGLNVIGVSRSEPMEGDISATYLRGDRCSRNFIREIVLSRKIDVVVDVIAMTLADTKRLIAELDGQISQYVMLSSCDVYRNYELLHRKSVGTPTAECVDEDSSLRVTRYPYRGEVPRETNDQYLSDYDKIPVEQAVQQLVSDWTILRLPMVYGPGDKQRRFRWAIGPMTQRRPSLVMPRIWADWETTYGYVENVAAAITAVLGNGAALKRVFNIAGVDQVNHFEWATRIAKVMKWNGNIEISNDPAKPIARSLQGLDLTVPFKIDGGRFRAELGFSEMVGVEACLKHTVADEISRSRITD